MSDSASDSSSTDTSATTTSMTGSEFRDKAAEAGVTVDFGGMSQAAQENFWNQQASTYSSVDEFTAAISAQGGTITYEQKNVVNGMSIGDIGSEGAGASSWSGANGTDTVTSFTYRNSVDGTASITVKTWTSPIEPNLVAGYLVTGGTFGSDQTFFNANYQQAKGKYQTNDITMWLEIESKTDDYAVVGCYGTAHAHYWTYMYPSWTEHNPTVTRRKIGNSIRVYDNLLTVPVTVTYTSPSPDPGPTPDPSKTSLQINVTGGLSGRHNDPIKDSSYHYKPLDRTETPNYGCGGYGGHGGGGGGGSATVVIRKFATSKADSVSQKAYTQRHGYGSGGGAGGKGADGCILIFY